MGEEEQADGKFIALHIGDYKLIKDGQTVKIIRVLPSAPEAEYFYSSELDGSWVAGKPMELPKATMKTELGTTESFTVEISRGGKVEKTFSSYDSAISYDFPVSGVYSVKYIFTDSNGFVYEDDTEIEVTDQKILIISETLSEKVNTYNEYYLGSAYGYYKQTIYPVTVKVTSPTGKDVKTENGSFTASETGVYTVKFSAEIEGETIEQSVSVQSQLTFGSYFGEGEGIISAESGVSVPEGVVYGGESVKLSLGGHSAKATFTQVINLNDFGKNDSLISFYVGRNEFSSINEIKVNVIDANDSENRFSVLWRQETAPGSEKYCYMLVNYDTYSLGINTDTGLTREYYGTLLGYTSFIVSDGVYPFNFSFDKEENAVYTMSSLGLLKILDMDDGELLPNHKHFEGFSSDCVYLEIELTTDANAEVYITSAGGYDTGNLPTSNKWYLRLDYDGVFPDSRLYDGQINKNYRLPVPYTDDAVFGYTAVECRLTRQEDGNETDISDMLDGYNFTPDTTGEYRVYYSCTDSFGRKTEKSFIFSIVSALSPLRIENEDITVGFGESFSAPEIIVSGGSGSKTVTVKYYKGDEQIYPDVNGRFLFDFKGKVKAEVYCEDFSGATAKKTFYINIDSDKRIIDVYEPPVTFIAGREYVLSDFSATDYLFEQGESGFEMTKTILVDGNPIGTDRKVVFESAGTHSVCFVGGMGTGREVRKEYSVSVLPSADENALPLEDYLIYGNGEVRENTVLFEKGMAIGINSDAQLGFPSVLPAERVEIGFSVLANSSYSLEFVFEDYLNPEQKIIVTVGSFAKDNFKLSVNDSLKYNLYAVSGAYESGPYAGSAFYSASFRLYGLKSVITNSTDQIVYTLRNFSSGDVFEGFDSGLVKITVNVKEVRSPSAFILNYLNNQTFTSVAFERGDTQGPVIGLVGELNSRAKINETVKIPQAYAYDVLQGKAVNMTAKVMTSSGETVDFDAYNGTEYVFKEYGIYTFVYEARDYFGNLGRYSFTVEVTDTEPPVITPGSMKEEYRVGDSVKLTADFSATDNVGVVLKKLYVRTPDSELISINGEFKFTDKGTYRFIYYAKDGAGNAAMKTVTVVVK